MSLTLAKIKECARMLEAARHEGPHWLSIGDPLAIPDNPPDDFSISVETRSLMMLSANDASELQSKFFLLGTKLNGMGYTVEFQRCAPSGSDDRALAARPAGRGEFLQGGEIVLAVLVSNR